MSPVRAVPLEVLELMASCDYGALLMPLPLCLDDAFLLPAVFARVAAEPLLLDDAVEVLCHIANHPRRELVLLLCRVAVRNDVSQAGSREKGWLGGGFVLDVAARCLSRLNQLS